MSTNFWPENSIFVLIPTLILRDEFHGRCLFASPLFRIFLSLALFFEKYVGFSIHTVEATVGIVRILNLFYPRFVAEILPTTWAHKEIRVLAGTKNSRPVGFYSRNSTKSTFNHKHNNPQHYHHGGAVCPSYGVGSMDKPDRTRRPSSEGVGREGGRSD